MGKVIAALCCATSLLCLNVACTLPALAEKRVALVIGNSTYSHTRSLPNARQDAYAMAAFLKAIDFEVMVRHDANYRDLRMTFRDFASASSSADFAVIYFAGHGLEVAGENFLVPTDARLASSSDLEYEAITLMSVLDLVRAQRKLNLIIVDACRNNPLAEKMVLREGTTRSVRRGLARVEPKGDMLIAFAANAGTVAQDGTGSNSPFVEALIGHLGKPGLDVRLALGGVRDAVLAATGNTQEPVIYGALGGQVISLVEPDPAAGLLGSASREHEAKTAWESMKQSCSAADLKLFTVRYGDTFFGDLGAKRVGEIERGSVCASRSHLAGDAKLIRSVQGELKRLGCFDGPISGNWGPQSSAGFKSYLHHAKLHDALSGPDEATLAELKRATKRVCPLVCKSDERLAGDRCLKHTDPAAAAVSAPAAGPVPKVVTNPRVVAGDCSSVRTACTQIRSQCLRVCREKLNDRTYGSCEGCLTSFSTCMTRGSAGACQ